MRIFIFCTAGLLAGSVGAQTSAHQHPVMPAQPKPAGTTPASGSGSPPSAPSHPPAAGHAGTPSAASAHPPAGHAGHAGKAMPSGHQQAMAFGPFSDLQEASGTAWQPEATPMHAHHAMRGEWQVMTHYNAFLGYDDQSGPRGDEQINSINWLMLMARRRSAENEWMARGMFSLEPWTTTAKGYPMLFQSGEAYHGRPLVDRQHPHDLFMEIAARYRRLVKPDTAVSLYVAPAGEPALGPPAFMHRMSAMDNPAAPISHHWQDSTHIAFGVLTAGLARKTWQLEGSWFNGREPDEDRWDIEKPNLDSYAGRFTWNPAPEWSAQVSHGYLKSPEELHPREHLWRTTASLMHVLKLHDGFCLATTAAWGRNDSDGQTGNAWLLESSCAMRRFTVFGRAEYVEKAAEDLELSPHNRKIRVKQLSVGLTRELIEKRPYQLALGGTVSYSLKPDDLDRVYGKNPVGFWIFLRLRPAAMEH